MSASTDGGLARAATVSREDSANSGGPFGPNHPGFNALLLRLGEVGLRGKALAWARRRGLVYFGDVVHLLHQGEHKAAGRKTRQAIVGLCHQLGLPPWQALKFAWGPGQGAAWRMARDCEVQRLAVSLHAARMPKTRTLEEDYENMRRYADLSEVQDEVVRMFFGMGPRHPMDCSEVARAVSLSRERVRQITDHFAAAVQALPDTYFPVMKDAHRHLLASGPRLVSGIGSWLRAKKYTREASGEGFLKILQCVGDLPVPRQLRLKQDGTGLRDRTMLQCLVRSLRKLTAAFGAASLEGVSAADKALVPEELPDLLEQVPNLKCLRPGWYYLAGGKRDRVGRLLMKLGYLERRYTEQELHEALLKALHPLKCPPCFLMPVDVLAGLMQLRPEWARGPDQRWARKSRSAAGVRSSVERGLAEILGDVPMSTRAILRATKKRKLNPGTVALYLSISPLWKRVEGGYVLAGAAPSPFAHRSGDLGPAQARGAAVR